MSYAAPHPPNGPPSGEAYDQWLVLRAQTGEERAVELLYQRWNKPLQRHAMRLTNNADGTADASQEAWLAIVRGLHRLQDPACFRRWAYQIVGRKCVDWIRSRQKQRAMTEPLATEPVAPTADTATSDESANLSETLKQLPNADRVVIALHYTDEMPVVEIAEVLGLPVGTVKSRLHHARQRLKAAIEREQRIETHQGVKK